MSIEELKALLDRIANASHHNPALHRDMTAIVGEIAIDTKRTADAIEALGAGFEAYVFEKRESSHFAQRVIIERDGR